MLNHNFKDLTNQMFTRLTALYPTLERVGGAVVWMCRCACGNYKKISSNSLLSGKVKSCGCLQKENRIKHGMVGTSIYGVWKAMIQRCNNLNCKYYENYGGRGIKICKRWHKFEHFYVDMGTCPKGLTLERKNNDGNYCPENCVWATREDQMANSRPKSYGSNRQRWFYGHGPKGEMIIENNQHKIAQEFDLNQGKISACLLGKLKKTRDWNFQFIKPLEVK